MIDMPGSLSPDDLLDIQEIFSRWSRAEDTGDSDGWTALFTEDGRCSYGRGETVVGHEALRRNSQQRWEKPIARRSAHWMGPAVIRPSETGADAQHYCMLIETTQDGGYRIRSVSERSYDIRHPASTWLVHSRSIRDLPASAD